LLVGFEDELLVVEVDELGAGGLLFREGVAVSEVV
jgi:hypothetical protein